MVEEVHILSRHFHFTPPFTNAVVSHKEELCVKGNMGHERLESEVMFVKTRNQQLVTRYKKPQMVHSVTQQYTDSTKPIFTSRKSYIYTVHAQMSFRSRPQQKHQPSLQRFSLNSQTLNSITSRIPILNCTGIDRAIWKVRAEIRFCPHATNGCNQANFTTFTLSRKVFKKKKKVSIQDCNVNC
jgi:hypothetical protein